MYKELEAVEKHIFPVMSMVLQKFEGTKYIFVSGDSTAVRAHTPYKRDIGDLDLIFHDNTDIFELRDFVLKHLPNGKYEDLVIVEGENPKGGFLRTRFPIDIVYRHESFFIVDFHVGGSVFYGKYACKVDYKFFHDVEWKAIDSISGLERVNIPVSSLEEMLLFKLRKFINKDRQDVLSLLTRNDIDFEYISTRVEFFGRDILFSNSSNLNDNIDIEIMNWIAYHGIEFPNDKTKIANTNLLKLREVARDENN